VIGYIAHVLYVLFLLTHKLLKEEKADGVGKYSIGRNQDRLSHFALRPSQDGKDVRGEIWYHAGK
jgi:hypothetical protein